MVIINLTEGTHTIKWTLSGYSDLIAQIRVSSTGAVSCISVTGGSCSGSSTPRISINGATVTGYMKSSGGPAQHAYLEKGAEQYSAIKAPMTKKYDASANGNYYIYNPSGYNKGGTVTYKFNVTQSGRYKLVAFVHADTHSHNSFGIKVNTQPTQTWDINPKSSWQWVNVSKRGSGSDVNPQYPIYYHDLSAGTHTILISDREEQTKLKKLILTNDLTYMPSGSSNSYQNWVDSKGGKAALKYNLSALLDIIDGYMKFKDLGFTVTLQNLLGTIDGYLGF